MVNNIKAYISLGANLGDRALKIRLAMEQLDSHDAIYVVDRSDVYETEPIGMDDYASWFLNQAITIKTTLSALELLQVCQNIEVDLGREDKGMVASRLIDIDILTYGDERIDEEALQIPHPRMLERKFVLVPLVQIAPEYKNALENCPDSHKVKPYEPRTN